MKLSLFSRLRRKQAAGEVAPQTTIFERRVLEQPGPPTGGLPYSVYDQMERDAMVQTALTVKRLGVLAVPWGIESEASPEAKRRVAFVQEAFERMEGSPNDILAGAMDAFAKGWSIQEVVYRPEGDRLWLHAVRPKDPSSFGLKLDAFGRLESLHLALPGETPRDLPPGKFVIFRHRGGYGRAKGRSDLDAAYPHWQSKQKLLDAWKLYLHKYASPTMLSKVGPTVSQADRDAIARALDDLDRSTSLVFPSDVDVSSIGGTRDASDAYMDAIDFHNREIARSILGQTLTTDEGRRVGSLAMGKVHLQVMMLQLDALRSELADTVMTEQVIRPLVELNFGPGPIPRFKFDKVALSAFQTGEI